MPRGPSAAPGCECALADLEAVHDQARGADLDRQAVPARGEGAACEDTAAIERELCDAPSRFAEPRLRAVRPDVRVGSRDELTADRGALLLRTGPLDRELDVVVARAVDEPAGAGGPA